MSSDSVAKVPDQTYLLKQRRAVLEAQAAQAVARGELDKVQRRDLREPSIDRVDAEAMAALATSVVQDALEQYFVASERALGRDPECDPVAP